MYWQLTLPSLLAHSIESHLLPNYLYKILSTPPTEPLPLIFPLSSSDASDGFIHLSTADQVLYVASRRYNTVNQLSALKLDYKWMIDNMITIEWVTSGNSSYPHLYGDLTKEMVVNWRTWTKKTNENWGQVIQSDSWLDNTFYSSGHSDVFLANDYLLTFSICSFLLLIVTGDSRFQY